MDHSSKFSSDLRRSPLHTSGSVAAQPALDSSFGVKSEVRPAPLHTSGSTPAQAARWESSSTAVKSGIRRLVPPLRSSGSVIAQPPVPLDTPDAKTSSWRGPEHSPDFVAETGLRQSIL